MTEKMKDKVNTGSLAGSKKGTTVLLIAIGLVVGTAIYFFAVPPAQKSNGLELPPEQKKTPGELVVDQAREMLAGGQPQGAVELMRDYITAHPTDTTVRLKLAELYLMLGQVSPARKQIDETLTISPDNPQGLWMKGMLANTEGKDPTEYFTRAAGQAQAGPEIWGMYGLWLISRNNFDTAKVFLDKAIAAGSMDAKIYMAAGQLAFESDKYDDAISLLQRATQVNPEDPRAWAMLADAQKNVGKPIQAIRSLEQGLKVAQGPIRGNLFLQLGMACMACKQWPRAAEVFEQATQYSDVQLQAYQFAARSHYFAEQYDKAGDNIDRAWALAPGNPEVKKWLDMIDQKRPGKKKKTAQLKPISLFEPFPVKKETTPETP